MNYKNIMLTLGLLTLFVVVPQEVDAARLSPQQALSRVQGSTSRLRVPGKSSYELTFTGQSDGENALYVFNKGETGFIVVSADDRLPALLGYSDNGAFDLETAPPGLKWWLGQYTKEAVYFFKNEDKYAATRSSVSTGASRAAVAPLVGTKWNQRAPYNDECPELNDKRCVTGCVATAMAQVMKYHNYPATGTGEHTYTYKGNTYSFNYGATTFDWTNMLDSYDVNATSEQNVAVAKLMHACGVGVNMGYGVEESGASDAYVAYALKQFFNYDKGVRYVMRDYYSDEEWEEMIYAELSARRPVIYGGQASGGGHEFVCDGYFEGKFHINWGWGGTSDGYFSLSLLNPTDQGTGSYEGGYNSDQTAVIGIQRPASGTTASYPIFCSKGFVYGGVNDNVLAYIIDGGGVYSLSPEDVTVNFYMKAVSESGDVYYSQPGRPFDFKGMVYNSDAGVGSYTMYSPIRVNLPSDLPAGTYKAYPVFKGSEGDYQPLLVPTTQTYPGYFDMTVDSDGKILFEDEKNPAQIRVTEFTPVGNVISGKPTEYEFTIENIGEAIYSGKIQIILFSHGSNKALYTMNVNGFSILAGQVYKGGITMTYTYPEGHYDIICYDKNGEKISDVYQIHIYDKEPDVMVATGIKLDKNAAELIEGKTVTLIATVEPETAADKSVTWTSSNEEVATVEEGVVTAVSAGEAVITAHTSNGYEATCTITVKVKEPEVIVATGITLDKTEAELVAGETLTLTATVDPEATTDKSVIWSSSDDKIARVNATGVVTAVSAGEAAITVTSNSNSELSASCKVTVKAKEPEVIVATGITLDKTEAEVVEGESVTLKATVDPETVSDPTVTWSTSDDRVATVDATGVVTAVSAGEAVITATSNSNSELKATCRITVKAKEPEVVVATGITLDKTEAEVVAGETLTLKATVDPETVSDPTVTWSSSDDKIATVNAAGVVTAVSAGEAVITATSNSNSELKATCKVTVKAKEPEVVVATGITLDKTEAEVVAGATLTLTATVDPEATSDKSVIWSSSNEEVATVDSDGVVTAVSEGEAVITATSNSNSELKATCRITVKAKEPEVVIATGITLDKTEAEVVEGESVTLKATVNPETVSDPTVTWSSSDDKIATVNAAGVVTAVSAGEAVITATSNSNKELKATCKITVKAKEPEVVIATGITLDKTVAEVVEGESVTLKATVDPETVSDPTVTWSSSDDKIATVNAAGIVTAVSVGEAVITATSNSNKELKATCRITVKAKEPEVILVESITLDKETIEAEIGAKVQLIAIVLPEDATDATLIWTSSDEQVATVDGNGLVTIVSYGSAVITAMATDGSGVSASCKISGLSGIESLVFREGNADVYTMNGLLLKKNADHEYISTLVKGIYIINISGRTYKVIK